MSRQHGHRGRTPARRVVVHELLDAAARRRQWPETRHLAEQLGVPALCYQHGRVVDEFWPNGCRWASTATDRVAKES